MKLVKKLKKVPQEKVEFLGLGRFEKLAGFQKDHEEVRKKENKNHQPRGGRIGHYLQKKKKKKKWQIPVQDSDLCQFLSLRFYYFYHSWNVGAESLACGRTWEKVGKREGRMGRAMKRKTERALPCRWKGW